MLSMRPKHNSTRAPKGAFDLVSECSRFSPILQPAGDDRGYRELAVDSGDDDGRSNGKTNEQDDDEIPIWICGEPRYISGIGPTTTCREIIQALIEDELTNDAPPSTVADLWRHQQQRPGKENCRQPAAKRHNNAKDFAAASRDLADYVITERWRDVEQALDAETHILPIWMAWGSARNEVRFKLKINTSVRKGGRYGSNGANEEVFHGQKHKLANDPRAKKKQKFKALAKMMKRLVLQSETIQERLNQLKYNEYKVSSECPAVSSLSQPAGKALLMKHFLNDSATSCAVEQPPPPPPQPSADEPRALENIYVHLYTDSQPIEPINIQSTDDELFLLIDDNHSVAVGGGAATNSRDLAPQSGGYASDDLDSGVHVEYRQYVLNRKLQSNAAAAAAAAAVAPVVANAGGEGNRLTDKLMKLSETPKRKYRTKCDFDRLRARSLNRAAVPLQPPAARKKPNRFSAIRLEVAKRLLDLDQLLQYEQQLQSTLAQRSAQFRAQNELYTRPGCGLAVATADIEQIQACLDAYTKDIVSSEFELFKIQLEITQKCGILHNLQRMQQQGAADEEADQDDETSSSTTSSSAAQLMADRIMKESRRRQPEEDVQQQPADSKEEFVDSTFADNVNEFCDKNQSIIV